MGDKVSIAGCWVEEWGRKGRRLGTGEGVQSDPALPCPGHPASHPPTCSTPSNRSRCPPEKPRQLARMKRGSPSSPNSSIACAVLRAESGNQTWPACSSSGRGQGQQGRGGGSEAGMSTCMQSAGSPVPHRLQSHPTAEHPPSLPPLPLPGALPYPTLPYPTLPYLWDDALRGVWHARVSRNVEHHCVGLHGNDAHRHAAQPRPPRHHRARPAGLQVARGCRGWGWAQQWSGMTRPLSQPRAPDSSTGLGVGAMTTSSASERCSEEPKPKPKPKPNTSPASHLPACLPSPAPPSSCPCQTGRPARSAPRGCARRGWAARAPRWPHAGPSSPLQQQQQQQREEAVRMLVHVGVWSGKRMEAGATAAALAQLWRPAFCPTLLLLNSSQPHPSTAPPRPPSAGM